MYSHWNIQWQTGSVDSGPVSSLLTSWPSIEVEDNAPTQDAIYVCSHCIHVNVVGAKRRGSVVLMLGYCRQWWPTLDRHRLGVYWWRVHIPSYTRIWHTALVLLCSYLAGYGGVCFVIHSRLITLSLSGPPSLISPQHWHWTLIWFWPAVYDTGRTSNQCWVNSLCFLGYKPNETTAAIV